MSRRQSRYRKHLTIYVNHSDLDTKLQDSDRSKSIIGFLRLGLIVLILAILGSIAGYVALISNKTAIANGLQSYASGIVAQLPANLTGSWSISGGSATLHLNNDKPFIVNLYPGAHEAQNEINMKDQSITVLIDTSLTSIPSSDEYNIIITQNALAMNNNNEQRIYDFNEISENNPDYQENEFFTNDVVQALPSHIATLVQDHLSNIGRAIVLIGMIVFLVIEAIVLVVLALWYFFLCAVIRCVISLITKIWKKEIPHRKWDLVAILGFGPFIFSLLFLADRLYVLAMIVYLTILIFQHHDFHQKKK